jgi:antitoxin (DNA-binding transcriptional repressor) of toxin-antitoxin stability system
MKTLSVAEVETGLGSHLERLEEEPILITRDGKPIAALVAVSDADRLERIVKSRPRGLRLLLEEADERITRTGGLSHQEFWRLVDERYGDEADATPKARKGKRRAPR